MALLPLAAFPAAYKITVLRVTMSTRYVVFHLSNLAEGSGCYLITCGTKPNYDVSVNGVPQTCFRPNQTLMWNGFRGNVTCVPWDEVC